LSQTQSETLTVE